MTSWLQSNHERFAKSQRDFGTRGVGVLAVVEKCFFYGRIREIAFSEAPVSCFEGSRSDTEALEPIEPVYTNAR